MKKQIWISIVVSIALFSCSKEENTPAAPAETYMSLTSGSTWNYKSTNNSTGTPVITNYTLTSSTRDTTVGSRSYHVFTRSNGGANEYYNISSNDYYTYQTLPAQLGGSFVENLYLKLNANVGDTWAQSYPVTFSGFPITITLTHKLEEKGISKTVNSIPYTGVYRISTTLSASGVPLPYTLSSDIQYYYAPKVGLIESKTVINLTVTGFPSSTTDIRNELQSATIL